MISLGSYASQAAAASFATAAGLIPAAFAIEGEGEAWHILLTGEFDHEAIAPAEAEKRNGITRPAQGATRMVWDFCDEFATEGIVPPRESVMRSLTGIGINPHTAATQFKLWRKFHGITGRITQAA